MRYKKGILCFLLAALLSSLFGCQGQEQQERTYGSMTDLTYEIVSGSDVPHKVNEKIFKEKEKGFGFTYRDGDVMYVAFGRSS